MIYESKGTFIHEGSKVTRLEHTFFCILITLVHFFTNNPLEGEVGSGLNSSLSEEGQISDQV
jgi:hypothetical protein